MSIEAAASVGVAVCDIGVAFVNEERLRYS
jgi:hypothetical protein